MADITGITVTGLLNLADNFYNFIPNAIMFGVMLGLAYLGYRITKFALEKILTRNAVLQKRDRENIITIWGYVYILLAAFALIFSFSGDLAATGISVGLITAALGWALQKPITGIAAWIMLLVKRPFKIGDRVVIGDITGDIKKIEMFYVSLREVGGRVQCEEKSGRIIMIPTSTLFDQRIINYFYENDYIMGEVNVEFTYDSNMEKAEKILLDAAEEGTKSYLHEVPRKPFVKYYFTPNGIRLTVRYFAKTGETLTAMSNTTKEIYLHIRKESDIEFAYQHTEVVLGKKTRGMADI